MIPRPVNAPLSLPPCRDGRRFRGIKVAGKTAGPRTGAKKGIKDGGEALGLSAEPGKGKYVALNKRLVCGREREDNKQVLLR